MAIETRLQWEDAGTLYYPDGGSWSKTRREAEASWSTPLGPGRYRIARVESRNGGYWEVVRLRPSNSTFKFNGKPRRFSGYGLGNPVNMEEAMAIAERDNARL